MVLAFRIVAPSTHLNWNHHSFLRMSDNEEDEDKVYRVKNEKPLRKPLAYSHVVSSSTHSLLLFHHNPVVQHSFHGLKKKQQK